MSVVNRSFGPYELVRRLGMGGMAETFEAVRLGPGGFEQRVCVKRILPTFEQDEVFVRLFLEEARVAARLRHANIVQVIDFGNEQGSHYLALELVVGCDLRELIRAERARAAASPSGSAGGLTSGLVVFLAMELAAALEVAHGGAQAIVHRDISPANVLLSTAGEVKLSDFGIARAIGNHQATATSTIKGKVPYMAPEYALRGHVDRRIDMFALGVLLYESLAGVRPFDGASELDTLSNIEGGRHVPLGGHCPDAPRALVEAIELLIKANPEERIQSAAALLDALVDVAPPPTARRILGELVTRTRSARPGGEGAGTAVDALGDTSIAPLGGAASGPTAPRAAPRSVPPAATAPPIVDAAAPRSESDSAAPRTAILDGEHSDAPPGASLPFATAGSADVTRTAAPAAALPDAATRAAATRTLVDSATALGNAETRMLARSEPAAAPATSAATGNPEATPLGAELPVATRRHAPVALVALGSIALLGSAALALFLVVAWQSPEPSSSANALTAPPVAQPAVARVLLAAPLTAAPPEATAPAAAPPPISAPTVVTPPPSGRERAEPDEPNLARRDGLTKRREARAAATAAANEDDLTTRALLSVVSDRGGDIYIDGRRAGASPASASVPPGRHVIANGLGDEATSLTVDITRGERRRVVLH